MAAYARSLASACARTRGQSRKLSSIGMYTSLERYTRTYKGTTYIYRRTAREIEENRKGESGSNLTFSDLNVSSSSDRYSGQLGRESASVIS